MNTASTPCQFQLIYQQNFDTIQFWNPNNAFTDALEHSKRGYLKPKPEQTPSENQTLQDDRAHFMPTKKGRLLLLRKNKKNKKNEC